MIIKFEKNNSVNIRMHVKFILLFFYFDDPILLLAKFSNDFEKKLGKKLIFLSFFQKVS